MYILVMNDDTDFHGAGCDCGNCNANGHSYGYAVYDLTPYGITHEFQLTDDIYDALRHEDPLDRLYGSSHEAALDRVKAAAKQQHWQSLRQGATDDQLIGALRMLVGEDGYLTQHGICECDNTHTQNYTMCRICWARAALNAALTGK